MNKSTHDSSTQYVMDDEEWGNDDVDMDWGDDNEWDTPQSKNSQDAEPPQLAEVASPPTEEEVRPNEQKCPHCNKWISSGAFFMHEMRCARLQTKCKECGESVSKPDLEDHMKRKHIKVECACGETVTGTDELDMHQKTECIYKMMTCQYCQEQFKLIEFTDHVERCGNEIMTCPECEDTYPRKHATEHVCSRLCHCGQRIPLKMYIFHKITDCPQRRALCTYCKLPRLTRTFDEHLEYCGSRTEQCLNCGQLVILKHMDEHISSNCTQFSAKQTSTNTNDLPPEYLRNLDFFNNDANFGAWGDSNAQSPPQVDPPPLVHANTMETDVGSSMDHIPAEPKRENLNLADPAVASPPLDIDIPVNGNFTCPNCGIACSDAESLDIHKKFQCVSLPQQDMINVSGDVKMGSPAAADPPLDPMLSEISSVTCPNCGMVCSSAETLMIHKNFECIAKQPERMNNWKPYQMPAPPQYRPQRNEAAAKWTCKTCTLENSRAKQSCEVCGMPRNG